MVLYFWSSNFYESKKRNGQVFFKFSSSLWISKWNTLLPMLLNKYIRSFLNTVSLACSTQLSKSSINIDLMAKLYCLSLEQLRWYLKTNFHFRCIV